MKYSLPFLLSIGVCIASLQSIQAEEVIIFESDQLSVIHGDSTNEDIMLSFGDSLTHFLQWDATKDAFVFSDDVSFSNHEIQDVRLENLNYTPACNSTYAGRIYYNTTDTYSYVCNGTDWRRIDADAAPGDLVPDITSISPSTVPQYSTQTIAITGTNFIAGAVVTIPGFTGTINSTVVASSELINLDLSISDTTDTIYDITVSQVALSGATVTDTFTNALTVTPVTSIIPGAGGITWNNIVGATTGVGTIYPSSTAVGWNKGASFGIVPANQDFTLVFKPEYMAGTTTGGNAMIGMDNSDPDQNYNTIDYSFYFANTTLYVYENGAYRGNFGAFAASDVFKMTRESGVIKYYKNNTLVYTSSTVSNTSMVFDNSLYRYIGATDIEIFFGIL